MKELSIYLETAMINQPLEDILNQSITSYPWGKSDSLKPWISKQVEPIFKYSEQESFSQSDLKPKGETLDETQFGLKPTQVKLHDLTQAETLDLEEQIGWHDFELTYVLGKGGMGIVYEGFQNSLKRSVAVKKSKSEQKYLAQIYHEAQITAFLDHPNILPVYDFAIDQDRNPIQVMKKINGVNWSKLLQDDHHDFWQDLEIPKNTNQRLLFHLDVLSKVSQAIAYAHEKHVIHRDLKPSNVMIGKFGEVFVLDWGIAVYIGEDHQDQFIAQKHANLLNTLVGTPAYMSPELANPKGEYAQCPATDVYLLAAILYEIFHHQHLHRGKNVKDVLEKIKNNHIPLLSNQLNHELKNLLYSSLSTDPSQRPENANQFRRSLQQVISSFKSRELEEKGLFAFNQLKNLLEKTDQETNQVNEQLEDASNYHFDEARHYFRSSLEYYELNEEAQMQYQSLLVIWIKHLLKKQDFKTAKRYLKELPFAEEDLEKSIQGAIQKFEKDQQDLLKLKKWQENESFQNSQKPRIYLALFSLVFLGGVSMILYLLSQKGIYHDSAKGRAIAVFFFGSVVIALSESWFRLNANQEQLNIAFKKVKYSIYVVLCVIMFARFLGWQYHNDYKIVLLHEMPLIILGSMLVSINTNRKDFFWGAIVFLGISVFTIFYPSHIGLLYALAQFNLWLTVSFFWYRDQKQTTMN